MNKDFVKRLEEVTRNFIKENNIKPTPVKLTTGSINLIELEEYTKKRDKEIIDELSKIIMNHKSK